MARAKRTDRADARRRYRATQSEVLDAEGADDEAAEATSTAGSSGRPDQRRGTPPRPSSARASSSSQSMLQPGQRPSFTASFRAAARPFDVRSDIAYIPRLLTRLPDARAAWIPAAAAVASGALFLASKPLGSNGLANLAFQLFVLPPTIAGAFLAGILAPRATYIAGGIAALIGAIVFSFAVAVTPINLSSATIAPSPAPSAAASAATASAAPSTSAAPSASGALSASPSASAAPGTPATATDSDKVGAILQSILLSVPFGIAIGAFGGYYKRFLALSNPNRQRRAVEQQRQKGQRQQPGKRRY